MPRCCALPTPPDANESAFGRDFRYATSSCGVVTGSEGCTTSATGTAITRPTGTRSRRAS